MTSNKRQIIDSLATTIRKALNLTIPFDPIDVVKLLNGDVLGITFEDPSISGRIQKKDKTFEISYDITQSKERINFTIAHELGHLFLHMGYLINDNKWNSIDEYYDSPKYRQGYSEEEYEANQFAGSFLMPKDEYVNFVRENIDTKTNSIKIHSIAKHFGVSFDAALTRGKWLGIFSW